MAGLTDTLLTLLPAGLFVLAGLAVADLFLAANRTTKRASTAITALALAAAGVAVLAGEAGSASPVVSTALLILFLAVLVLVVLLVVGIAGLSPGARADAAAPPPGAGAAPAGPTVQHVEEALSGGGGGLVFAGRDTTAASMLETMVPVLARAGITAFLQDDRLVYRWIVNPRFGWQEREIVGRSEEDLVPPEFLPLTLEPKRRALATGEPEVFHLDLAQGEESISFLVDVMPVSGPDGARWLVGLAADVTQQRQLEAARADLSRRLAQTLRQLRLTLRSGRIAVTSQDRDLVYHWSNGAFEGFATEDVIGRTDADILPAEDRQPVIDLKRAVIETGQPLSREVGVGTGPGRRYFDLHVEPDTDSGGEVVGVTCAAVDVTHRRRNEEQMRQVMRELTHRTKNLLAVTIAIARQTAQGAGSVKDYVEALTGRLRALSAAQDLIVADNWGGVDLSELVWLQIAQSQGPEAVHFDVDGPRVTLTPEVSQNLGLAIHELAANAQRHGAFSVAGGRVKVAWRIDKPDGRAFLTIDWREEGGPPVRKPSYRGFGLNVLERTLARSLDAEVHVAFREEGLAATLSIPLEQGVTLGDA